MNRKKFLIMIVTSYFMSIIVCVFVFSDTEKLKLEQHDLGMFYIETLYPGVSRGMQRGEIKAEEIDKIISIEEKDDDVLPSITEHTNLGRNENDVADSSIKSEVNKIEKVISENDPLVIIYHTHATESYQPVTEGNFHSKNEKGTVREVGNVIKKELEALGFNVIHDKTLHDAESYNQSYSRSLSTLNDLLQNKNPVMIIDLHRDAASYTGNTGKTAIIEGETVATFSLVVGKGNNNYNKLYSLATDITDKAEELYPGIGGKIIIKPYKYNQSVSDKCILLEVGNNENNIREACASGKYIARTIAKLYEEKKI